VPAEAGDDAVGRPGVLDLEHRPLARLVDAGGGFGDDAVEAGALEPGQPIGGNGGVGCDRRQVNGRQHAGERRLEMPAPLGLGQTAQILVADRERIECDERGWTGVGQLGHPGSGRVQAQLQRVEVEPVRRRDDDLAVDDTAVRQAGNQRVVQLGEIAIERPQVAALHEQVIAGPEDNRAEAVPLRLVQEIPRRNRIGNLCQHRLDRRRDGER
jgi:hypothetical protein